MKSYLRSSYLLSALAAAALLTACASTPPNRFELADTDKDQKLSSNEISDFIVTGVFKGRDANSDGKMTKEEWLVAGDDQGIVIFKERDANRDGVVTLQEAIIYGRKKGTANVLLKEADTNRDGFLTRDEARAYYGSKEGSVR